MTQEAANYPIWRPEYDGHEPPNWREGMAWADGDFNDFSHRTRDPFWHEGYLYRVPAEALNSPNDDATAGQKIECVEIIVGSKRKKEIVSLNELARLIKGGAAIYGITLAPEKDWATELWAELFAVRGMPSAAKSTREGRLDDEDQAAIALIRERVVLKGEG